MCKSMSTSKTETNQQRTMTASRDSTEVSRQVIQGVRSLRQGEREGAKRACDATDGTAGHESRIVDGL